MIASALVSVMLIWVGDYYRSISRRELLDLHELHELSTALASIPKLPDQLQLILRTSARMHGADKGLISIHDPQRDGLTVAASFSFSPQALEAFRDGVMGACAMARTRTRTRDHRRHGTRSAIRGVARTVPRRKITRGACDAAGEPRWGGAGRARGALRGATQTERTRISVSRTSVHARRRSSSSARAPKSE